MFLIAKYGTSLTIEFPMIKRGVVDYAVGADWTPASGDVKISNNGGAAASTTNLPSALTMGNGAVWQITITATEMQAARLLITIVDAATKAVEDQAILILTCGNASAWFVNDLTAAQYAANVTQYGGSNGTFASGRPEVNATHIAGSSVSTSTAQIGVNVVNFGGSAGTFASGRPEVNSSHWGGTAVASANVRSDLRQILGTTITESVGGRAAGAFSTQHDVATPVFTCASVNQTGDSYARIGATGSGLSSLAPASTALSTATWTATRAGYLDNLSGGAVALASGVTVTTIGAGVITASAIAADAIGASELAADAVAEIAAAVWDLTTTGHTTGGTFGAAMNAAGSAGDPWSTALPGAYSAGSAGYILGTNLNATVSSRLASASYTAPLDAAGTRSAVGMASANLDAQLASIQTDTTTLLARITSTLFSGITSLGQWLGLLAGKQTGNSTARTEIRATGAGSGTFSETTDSLEAVRDRGDAAWVTGSGGGGGTGSGAYTLTITVDDGITPLQNASVRLVEGVTDLIGTTDVNGEVVFSVDAATWAVAITKNGYQFTPTTLAVSASDSVTYSMTQVSVAPNPDADKSTVVVTCYGADTEVEPGATLYVRQITAPSGDEDHAYSGSEIEYTADESGVVTLTLWAGARYEVHRGDKRWLTTITPAAGTDSLASFVGKST